MYNLELIIEMYFLFFLNGLNDDFLRKESGTLLLKINQYVKY